MGNGTIKYCIRYLDVFNPLIKHSLATCSMHLVSFNKINHGIPYGNVNSKFSSVQQLSE